MRLGIAGDTRHHPLPHLSASSLCPWGHAVPGSSLGDRSQEASRIKGAEGKLLAMAHHEGSVTLSGAGATPGTASAKNSARARLDEQQPTQWAATAPRTPSSINYRARPAIAVLGNKKSERIMWEQTQKSGGFTRWKEVEETSSSLLGCGVKRKKKNKKTNSRVIKQTIREDKSRESLTKRALKLLQLIV